MNAHDDDPLADESIPETVAAAVACLAPPAPASPGDVRRIMKAVWRRHAKTKLMRLAGSTVGVAAASLLVGSLFVSRSASLPDSPVASGKPIIRFKLQAPSVRRLSLVGDFNSWDSHAAPMVRDSASGVWQISVTLQPGRYLYAFIADGTRWLPDPEAPLASADDFARQNSVIVVSPRVASDTVQR